MIDLDWNSSFESLQDVLSELSWDTKEYIEDILKEEAADEY